MTIADNNLVTANDVKDRFQANVINIVTTGTYHSTNVPKYSGTAGTFNAIPPGDLGAPGEITNITIPTGVIDGKTVYNLMLAVVKNCTRVRNFTSNLYYQSGGSYTNALQSTVNGKAVFKQSLPGIAGGYDRNINGSLLVNPSAADPISGQIANPSRLNQLCTNMLSAWQSIANTKLVYNCYTCHSNCHSDCHSDRSRR